MPRCRRRLPKTPGTGVAFWLHHGPYGEVQARLGRPLPHVSGRYRIRLITFALGATATFLVASCSDQAGDRSSPTTARHPSTTTTTEAEAETPEAAVLAGYRAFWMAFLRAGDPMDPQHPDLAATATGAQLEQVQRAFVARRAGAEVIRGTIEPHPRLVGAVEGNSATVADCYTDDSHIFDAATGAQKDDPAPVNHQVRVDMVLVDSTWKVAAIHYEGKGCTPS